MADLAAVELLAARLPDRAPPADWASLSPGERLRAARYRRPLDAQRYAGRRALLRRALARRLDCRAAAVPLVASLSGRPGLAGGGVWFSLAHSRDVVLLALAAGCEVGCDLEHRASGAPLLRGADCAADVAALRALGCAQDLGDPLRVWTLKEAYLKARGLGLAVALETAVRDDAGGWALTAFEPFAGYQASLAVRSADLSAVTTYRNAQSA